MLCALPLQEQVWTWAADRMASYGTTPVDAAGQAPSRTANSFGFAMLCALGMIAMCLNAAGEAGLLPAAVEKAGFHTVGETPGGPRIQFPADALRLSIYGDSISEGCCCVKGPDGGLKNLGDMGGPRPKGEVMSGFPALLTEFLGSDAALARYGVRMLAGSGRTATQGGNPKCYLKSKHSFDGGDKHSSVWGPKAIRGKKAIKAQLKEFKAQASAEKPDTVMIMLGTNDAYTNWTMCESSYVKDMTALIKLHQDTKLFPHSPRVMLVNPPISYTCQHPVGETSVHPYTDARCAEAGAANMADPNEEVKCIVKCVLPRLLSKIAAKTGLAAPVDLSSVIQAGSMRVNSDGHTDIHPTCEGHQSIFNVIKKDFLDHGISDDMAAAAALVSAQKPASSPVDVASTEKHRWEHRAEHQAERLVAKHKSSKSGESLVHGEKPANDILSDDGNPNNPGRPDEEGKNPDAESEFTNPTAHQHIVQTQNREFDTRAPARYSGGASRRPDQPFA